MLGSLLGHLGSFGSMLLLAFGFGFVIFWHELGHFLAAKWADVKVEQFAVGFGNAMFSWRKGLGFTWGSSQDAYQKRLKDHLESQTTQAELKVQITPTEAQLSAAAAELNISETEYRLNYIPLGGYVKMLGQDDLKPGQTVSDPRSYNNKTIAQRMVIVSAGVIMNVILAAIGFIFIFTVGFRVTRPMAGLVVPGAPAQNCFKEVNGKEVITPLQVGDTILKLNGKDQSDFDKIRLNTALLIDGEKVAIQVQHPDGQIEDLFVRPKKPGHGTEFPAIGMAAYPSLKGPPVTAKEIDLGKDALIDELKVIGKGDEIVALKEGDKEIPLKENEYYKLDRALQKAAGMPITVMVKGADNKIRPKVLKPHFTERFTGDAINFAGMEMLARIDTIQGKSPLIDKMLPGDVVISIADPSASGDQWVYPTRDEMIKQFNAAGDKGIPLNITLLRNGQEVVINNAKPSVKLGNGKYGFGIQPAMDESDPIVAEELVEGSPAKLANVRGGSVITAINGTPVHNWFDVKNIMSGLKAGETIKLTTTFEKVAKTYDLPGLSQPQIDEIKSGCLDSYSTGTLMPEEYDRQAHNPYEAVTMGVGETRDAILQVYQTVRSMSKGSISFKEVSGPVGILTAGYMVAERGITHLVWFLSIISANLAVMNFLPIPIVDGGLFTFLIIEKIKGSPISPRVQAIAQVVGLALLLSVFLFATYQDVFTRLPMLFK